MQFKQYRTKAAEEDLARNNEIKELRERLQAVQEAQMAESREKHKLAAELQMTGEKNEFLLQEKAELIAKLREELDDARQNEQMINKIID